MSAALKMNDSIVGYITNVSNENKKTKFYLKFSMHMKNDEIVDGWVFSSASGILSTPLGMALTDSLMNHSGLRLWGALEQERGLSVFKTQSYGKFQKVNPDFLFRSQPNEFSLVRDALVSTEPCSIRVFIIDIHENTKFRKSGIIHTNTFVLVGDHSGTCFLAAIDLTTKTIQAEKTFDLSHVRRKLFNGVPILITTIDTRITCAAAAVTPDVSLVSTTLSMDLSDQKIVVSSIEEFGSIARSTGCSTCKGELIDVTVTGALVFCSKCKRHSLKKNINQDQSTSFVIKKDEEKIFLMASGSTLDTLLSLAGISSGANDEDIAMCVLSSGDYRFEYHELTKELMNVSKMN